MHVNIVRLLYCLFIVFSLFVCCICLFFSKLFITCVVVAFAYRYPGRFNLYKKVITLKKNLKNMTFRQLNTKFLPLDSPATNTPRKRKSPPYEPRTVRYVVTLCLLYV